MVLLQRAVRTPSDPCPMWTAALPAFAWREVLAPGQLRVRVHANGTDIALIGRTGSSQRVHARAHVDGVWETTIAPADEAWLWVDGDVDIVEWEADEEIEQTGVTAVVPTFGRPVEATAQTRALLAAEVVNHVVVIDQAGALFEDAAFARLLEQEPDRVLLIEQDNIGGSGGYARGMIEAQRWPDDAVFLSDDDALIDGESLRRMVVLQALASARGERSLIGTGMRATEQPEKLISLSERVEPRRFWWCPADRLVEPLDLSTWSPDWDRLVPEHPVDYAGWWGALLPPGAVTELGLPAPYFLKWDDAEYGLRARRRGYTVRALPGVAVQHPTWAAKGTAGSWASYPLHRNRLATAAAYRAGRGVILDSLLHQVKHVLSLQYSTAQMWQHGAHTMLSGPQTWLGTDLRRTRPEAQQILDAAPVPDTVADGGDDDGAPSLLRAVTGLWRRVDARVRTRRVDALDLGWRRLLGADRAVVIGLDGQPAAVLQRDPRRARALLRDIAVSHARLALSWGALQASYRRALPRTFTQEFWLKVIDGGADA